jgi:hypothetical protein
MFLIRIQERIVSDMRGQTEQNRTKEKRAEQNEMGLN